MHVTVTVVLGLAATAVFAFPSVHRHELETRDFALPWQTDLGPSHLPKSRVETPEAPGRLQPNATPRTTESAYDGQHVEELSSGSTPGLRSPFKTVKARHLDAGQSLDVVHVQLGRRTQSPRPSTAVRRDSLSRKIDALGAGGLLQKRMVPEHSPSHQRSSSHERNPFHESSSSHEIDPFLEPEPVPAHHGFWSDGAFDRWSIDGSTHSMSTSPGHSATSSPDRFERQDNLHGHVGRHKRHQSVGSLSDAGPSHGGHRRSQSVEMTEIAPASHDHYGPAGYEHYEPGTYKHYEPASYEHYGPGTYENYENSPPQVPLERHPSIPPLGRQTSQKQKVNVKKMALKGGAGIVIGIGMIGLSAWLTKEKLFGRPNEVNAPIVKHYMRHYFRRSIDSKTHRLERRDTEIVSPSWVGSEFQPTANTRIDNKAGVDRKLDRLGLDGMLQKRMDPGSSSTPNMSPYHERSFSHDEMDPFLEPSSPRMMSPSHEPSSSHGMDPFPRLGTSYEMNPFDEPSPSHYTGRSHDPSPSHYTGHSHEPSSSSHGMGSFPRPSSSRGMNPFDEPGPSHYMGTSHEPSSSHYTGLPHEPSPSHYIDMGPFHVDMDPFHEPEPNRSNYGFWSNLFERWSVDGSPTHSRSTSPGHSASSSPDRQGSPSGHDGSSGRPPRRSQSDQRLSDLEAGLHGHELARSRSDEIQPASFRHYQDSPPQVPLERHPSIHPPGRGRQAQKKKVSLKKMLIKGTWAATSNLGLMGLNALAQQGKLSPKPPHAHSPSHGKRSVRTSVDNEAHRLEIRDPEPFSLENGRDAGPQAVRVFQESTSGAPRDEPVHI